MLRQLGVRGSHGSALGGKVVAGNDVQHGLHRARSERQTAARRPARAPAECRGKALNLAIE